MLVQSTAVELGGRTRAMLYDFGAWRAIEDTTELPAHSVINGNRSAKNMVVVVWAGLLRNEPRITQREVGAMLNIRNIGGLSEAINAAMKHALPDPKPRPDPGLLRKLKAAAKAAGADGEADKIPDPVEEHEAPERIDWWLMAARAQTQFGISESRFWRLTWRYWAALNESHEQTQDREDWRMGMLLAIYVNAHRGKRAQLAKPQDFMLRKPAGRKQTPEQQLFAMKTMAAMMKGAKNG